MSIITCPRCATRTIFDPATPAALRPRPEDCGAAEPSRSKAAAGESICPECAIDEIHIAVLDGDPLPGPEHWPVAAMHPMTLRFEQIMDEEVARVVARRQA